ncbi:MAG: class I SAM-dependent methyltransferase [Coriobacteriia bacterium]|nr:class I SAM-dependent methyltransferase [Coriobacteriia bacterium]
MSRVVYIHDERDHPLKDSEEMLPLLFSRLKPKTVIDVGCGIGTFLNTAQKLGAEQIVGVDGDWVDREKLRRNIALDYFVPITLTESLSGSFGRFDLAICLEVAEHLPESSAETLVESLVSLSDIILFSAAIPGQGGQNHINEQWPGYWAALFKEQDYLFADVIRPLIWDNDDISYWYRQNTFLVVKQDRKELLAAFSENWSEGRSEPLRLVHPALFEHIPEPEERLQRIYAGKLKRRAYLYLFGKSLFRKKD